jgi:hypothetical protein
MTAAIAPRWTLRGRLFVRAAFLGAIFGAISGALAYPVMAIAAGIEDGESVTTLISWVRLLAFAPATGLVGAGVGIAIGVIIGLVVASIGPHVRAGTFPVFVRGVVLVVTIAATFVAWHISHGSLIWCVIPGVFAIVLGQVGARWLIKVAVE